MMKKLNIKQYLIKNKYTILFLVIILVMGLINESSALNALSITGSNLLTMMGVIPPIFILIGLLDVWVPRETLIRFMGNDSGLLGLFIAFLLGSMAAGPLYAAFPIAAILLKKGARFAYVIFFLGTWTSAKIPLLLFEMTSLGIRFTIIHVVSMLTMYLIGSLIIERLLSRNEISAIVERASTI